MLSASVDFEIELVTLALVEAAEPRPFDRADVNERIGLTVVARQEAETLHRIEELHRAYRLLAGKLTTRSAFASIAAATGAAAAALFLHGNDIAYDLKILSRDLPASVDQVEFEFLAFAQAFETSAFDRADMDEDIFSAAILLDEAEALLRVEELDRSLAGSDDLGRHAVSTTGSAAAATVSTAEPAAAIATAAESTAAATVAATESVTATAAAKTVTAATEAISTAEAALRFETAAATATGAAERIETVFPKTVAFVPSPTASSIVTHNSNRTLSCSPLPQT